LFSGLDRLRWLDVAATPDSDALRGGTQLGVVEFSHEGKAPLGQAMGSELDGRLFTDLASLTPENPVPPGSAFYIRTRASRLLDTTKPWTIPLAGLVDNPSTISFQELKERVQPMGLHLMECAGNSRSAHFGMLSVADWEGVSLERIIDQAKPKAQAARVLISGFDEYAAESKSSWPGASWIFTLEQLRSSGAFLATGMNGLPLTADHGAPVRLVVPGWYGCTCIKWVNEISLVEEEVAATTQMQEYASRTAQNGVPRLAKEYQPARIEIAAMPIRIEKWSVKGRVKFRVVGIQWGGSHPIELLEIRFNPEESFALVEDFRRSTVDSWNFWSQVWTPEKTGSYLIQLRLKGSNNVARRLDSGYYVRSVEITEN
jgi:DMSO/TMAO reductase YedYZ molybdopterin-dependent catalytic subunit